LRDLRFTGVFAKVDRAEVHLLELRRLLEAHLRRPDLIAGRLGYWIMGKARCNGSVTPAPVTTTRCGGGHAPAPTRRGSATGP